MNGGGLAGLTTVALGLSGAIGLEILNWQAMSEEAAAVRPVSVASSRTSVALVEPPDRHDEQLNTILARPLFSPDRRPEASGARSVSGLPRLAGIVMTGSRRVAIFAAPGSKPVVVDEGARIGPYDVKAISESGVTVVGPEGTMVLRPMFDSAPPPAGRAPPARTETPKPPTR